MNGILILEEYDFFYQLDLKLNEAEEKIDILSRNWDRLDLIVQDEDIEERWK